MAGNVLGPDRDAWGAQGPAVLRTIPIGVLDPDHNSIITRPDDRARFLVYDAWDQQRTARRMCIAPLHWIADGPCCARPTMTIQMIDLPL